MRRRPRPLLYAHRGAAAERPENTLPSFARALEHGADAIETDVHLTRDGHVVVSHDPTGARMAGVARAIRACTLDEVRGWDAGWGFLDARGERPFAGQGLRLPTLEEALVEFPGVRFNVDVKPRGGPVRASLLAMLRRLGAEERVLLASFDTCTLRAIRRAKYAGRTGMGRTEIARLALMPGMLLAVLPRAGDVAQVPERAAGVELAGRRFVDTCHALGIEVDVWTINDAARAGELLALGVDGVMSDDPGAVAPAFAAYRTA